MAFKSIDATDADPAVVTSASQQALLLSGTNSNPDGARIYRSHIQISGMGTDFELLPQAPDGFKSQVLALWISCSVAPSIVRIQFDGSDWDTGGVGDPYGTHSLAEGASVFLIGVLGGPLGETPQSPDPLPIMVTKTTGATLDFTIYWRNVAL